MNILQNLVLLYNKEATGTSYHDICQKILNNIEEASRANIYEMAEMANASRTTLWRMIQKLGYASFSEFHFELRQAVNQYAYFNRVINTDSCRTVVSSDL